LKKHYRKSPKILFTELDDGYTHHAELNTQA